KSFCFGTAQGPPSGFPYDSASSFENLNLSITFRHNGIADSFEATQVLDFRALSKTSHSSILMASVFDSRMASAYRHINIRSETSRFHSEHTRINTIQKDLYFTN